MIDTDRVLREDFELACIREFSHSGIHFGIGVSPAERRKRIRCAILVEHKARLRWRDTALSYAEAFAQAYGELLLSGDADGAQSERPGSLGNVAIGDVLDDEDFEEDDGVVV